MLLRGRRAFTLIELLVVIGIIAGLVAIALPALALARHTAKVTVCLTNVKGLGTAFACYLSDNKQFYPGNTTNVAWQFAPNEYDLFGPNGTNTFWADNETRLLNRYLTDFTKGTRCPLDIGDSRAGVGTANIPAYTLFGTSYQYRNRTYAEIIANTRRVFSGVWVIEGHNERFIKYPDKKVIISDLPLFDAYTTTNVSERPATNAMNRWHNTGSLLKASALLSDGHAENITRKPLSLQYCDDTKTDEELLSTNEYY